VKATFYEFVSVVIYIPLLLFEKSFKLANFPSSAVRYNISGKESVQKSLQLLFSKIYGL
jgi:hypothetical protein